MLPPREMMKVFILTQGNDDNPQDNDKYSGPFKFIDFFFEKLHGKESDPDVTSTDNRIQDTEFGTFEGNDERRDSDAIKNDPNTKVVVSGKFFEIQGKVLATKLEEKRPKSTDHSACQDQQNAPELNHAGHLE